MSNEPKSYEAMPENEVTFRTPDPMVTQPGLSADAEMVLAAIKRMEAAVRSERAAPSIERLRAQLREMADIIFQAKAAIAPGNQNVDGFDVDSLLWQLKSQVDAIELLGPAAKTPAHANAVAAKGAVSAVEEPEEDTSPGDEVADATAVQPEPSAREAPPAGPAASLATSSPFAIDYDIAAAPAPSPTLGHMSSFSLLDTAVEELAAESAESAVSPAGPAEDGPEPAIEQGSAVQALELIAIEFAPPIPEPRHIERDELRALQPPLPDIEPPALEEPDCLPELRPETKPPVLGDVFVLASPSPPDQDLQDLKDIAPAPEVARAEVMPDVDLQASFARTESIAFLPPDQGLAVTFPAAPVSDLPSGEAAAKATEEPEPETVAEPAPEELIELFAETPIAQHEPAPTPPPEPTISELIDQLDQQLLPPAAPANADPEDFLFEPGEPQPDPVEPAEAEPDPVELAGPNADPDFEPLGSAPAGEPVSDQFGSVATGELSVEPLQPVEDPEPVTEPQVPAKPEAEQMQVMAQPETVELDADKGLECAEMFAPPIDPIASEEGVSSTETTAPYDPLSPIRAMSAAERIALFS
jgi:hypothetical protein